jgi:crotonobetainyl-CoA:carnitine CoA-transferase CaiB-like acyl-CoA transferase
MSGPLAGVRVVDLSERSPAAAIAGMVLADYGAEVFRIEPPGGDPIRVLDGASIWFRGQRSVRSDEIPPDYRDDLCRSADVVIDTLQASRLEPSPWPGPAGSGQVVCLLSAEPVSPETVTLGGRGAEDLHGEVLESRYGLQTAQNGHRPGPIFEGWPMALNGAAWLIEIGILAGLHAREATGRGTTFTTSLADGLAILSTHRWVGSKSFGIGLQRSTIGGPGTGNRIVVTGLVRCQDGRWLQIHTGARGAFDRLFAALGRPDLASPEPALAGTSILSAERIAAIWEFLEAIFIQRTAGEWVRLLADADVSAMPVLEPGEALRLPQVEANGLVQVTAERRSFGLPASFAATPARPGGAAPEAGPAQWHARQQEGPVSPRAGTDAPPAVPLAGLLVLDFGIWIAGPFANRVFADLGARVIKVEEVNGDPLRATPKQFLSSQRGKQSLAVNLKTENGQEIVHRLVCRADIVHHNMRAGVMERLGMGYQELRRLKPDLIYCHSSGYGNRGEWSRLPAFEPLHSALAGLLARTGGPGRPPLHYLTHMDFGCALTSATAVLAALWHRDRTGEGQYLECPQVGSALLAMADVHIEGTAVHESFAIDPDQRGHAATNALYRCRDGWLTIAANCQRDWLALHAALDLESEIPYSEVRRQRFDHSYAARRLQERLDGLTVAEAGARLAASGVAHAAPIEITDEAALFATAFARSGGIENSVHPDHGQVFAVGDTLRFLGVPQSQREPVARLGQDTDAILAELGYDKDQRAALFDAGVVRGDRIHR